MDYVHQIPDEMLADVHGGAVILYIICFTVMHLINLQHLSYMLAS